MGNVVAVFSNIKVQTLANFLNTGLSIFCVNFTAIVHIFAISADIGIEANIAIVSSGLEFHIADIVVNISEALCKEL